MQFSKVTKQTICVPDLGQLRFTHISASPILTNIENFVINHFTANGNLILSNWVRCSKVRSDCDKGEIRQRYIRKHSLLSLLLISYRTTTMKLSFAILALATCTFAYNGTETLTITCTEEKCTSASISTYEDGAPAVRVGALAAVGALALYAL
ncbi:hypothetical protein KL909_000254 [Ogataea angusta]|nr:hypothetical protein KL909_000254 [Ogataea angusta]KAG7832051.1 hypothetical protein KL920_000386 [Ogataea angusta]KAG7836223.1 hypothetical protein KL943_001872 [Ogataea angusta]